MKLTKILAALFMCALLISMIGCGQKEESSDTTTDEATTTMEDKTEAIADSFEATKEAFVSTAKTTLDGMNTQISDAKEKLAAMPGMTQKPLERTLEDVEELQQNAKDKLTALENADEAGFETAKSEFNSSVQQLEKTMTDLTSKL
ncbi:MAG: hypothetical protein DWP97_01465 [Calditrichaeota bacterium]|nr:MAG: hypothetical protein DWP97_01465 [Calditrichota bacterium]